jgi:hypothetical protein
MPKKREYIAISGYIVDSHLYPAPRQGFTETMAPRPKWSPSPSRFAPKTIRVAHMDGQPTMPGCSAIPTGRALGRSGGPSAQMGTRCRQWVNPGACLLACSCRVLRSCSGAWLLALALAARARAVLRVRGLTLLVFACVSLSLSDRLATSGFGVGGRHHWRQWVSVWAGLAASTWGRLVLDGRFPPRGQAVHAIARAAPTCA